MELKREFESLLGENEEQLNHCLVKITFSKNSIFIEDGFMIDPEKHELVCGQEGKVFYGAFGAYDFLKKNNLLQNNEKKLNEIKNYVDTTFDEAIQRIVEDIPGWHYYEVTHVDTFGVELFIYSVDIDDVEGNTIKTVYITIRPLEKTYELEEKQ